MVEDKWLSSYQAAHALALRSTPDPLPTTATAEEKRQDKLTMKAFYKRVERGTVPAPAARLPGGDLRFKKSAIDEYKKEREKEFAAARGRKRGAA